MVRPLSYQYAQKRGYRFTAQYVVGRISMAMLSITLCVFLDLRIGKNFYYYTIAPLPYFQQEVFHHYLVIIPF